MLEISDLITIAEVASELNVSRRAVYDAIEKGQIEAVDVLGKKAVVRSSLVRYVPRAYEGKRENHRPQGVKGPGGRGCRITLPQGDESLHLCEEGVSIEADELIGHSSRPASICCKSNTSFV